MKAMIATLYGRIAYAHRASHRPPRIASPPRASHRHRAHPIATALCDGQRTSDNGRRMIYTVTLNPALDRELTVPALLFDDVLRATETRVDCGGKGFNVARMLAALGAESVALGFAGGHTGAMLRDGLAALGITTDFVWIAGETRTNVSIVAADYSRHIKVNEPGPIVSAREQAALRARSRERARSGDWRHRPSIVNGLHCVRPVAKGQYTSDDSVRWETRRRSRYLCPASRSPDRECRGGFCS
jgi:pfkB family carbohydrate kinase